MMQWSGLYGGAADRSCFGGSDPLLAHTETLNDTSVDGRPHFGEIKVTSWWVVAFSYLVLAL